MSVAHFLKERGTMSKLIEFAREIERIQKQPKEAERKTNFNGWHQGTWVNAQTHLRRFKMQGSA
jgi:hypothetical protein